MKKLLFLMLVFIPFVNIMAQQDSEGYYDITRNLDNGGIYRHIQSPDRYIRNKAIVSKEYDTDIYVSYYNILVSEVSRKNGKKNQYKLGFDIEDNIDFSIVKNNRLLIKLKNGQTIMLRTTDNRDANYLSDRKYHVTVNYAITTQQLDNIIKIGVTKFRIETQLRNLDIVPDFDVSQVTKAFKTGLYDRLNNKKDAFTSDF